MTDEQMFKLFDQILSLAKVVQSLQDQLLEVETKLIKLESKK